MQNVINFIFSCPCYFQLPLKLSLINSIFLDIFLVNNLAIMEKAYLANSIQELTKATDLLMPECDGIYGLKEIDFNYMDQKKKRKKLCEVLLQNNGLVLLCFS